eukprot:PITA_19716
MEAFIRKFFWKGDNLNDKKIPLVSWEKICKPQNEGGLNFKDLSLQNTAMGAKIFWRIIGPHPGWAQRTLWRKYFMGKQKRCLESSLPTSRLQLIKLCHKATPLIRDRAYWIPGNGCVSLWDISLWAGSNWLRWRLSPVPPELIQECDLLLTLLNGKAPLRVGRKDAHGWGAAPRLYTVAQGYKSLHDRPHVPPDPIVWKGLWTYKTMPKIDSFRSLLCHKGILTEDRLKKKGFQGPSRCRLCCHSEENAQHIILDCKFSKEIWQNLLSHWKTKFILPMSISDLFANWQNFYPKTLPKYESFNAAWLSLPKFIC